MPTQEPVLLMAKKKPPYFDASIFKEPLFWQYCGDWRCLKACSLVITAELPRPLLLSRETDNRFALIRFVRPGMTQPIPQMPRAVGSSRTRPDTPDGCRKKPLNGSSCCQAYTSPITPPRRKLMHGSSPRSMCTERVRWTEVERPVCRRSTALTCTTRITSMTRPV